MLHEREEVAFYVSERQVEGGDSPEVDTVKVRIRGSKGEQERKGERADEDERWWDCCTNYTRYIYIMGGSAYR